MLTLEGSSWLAATYQGFEGFSRYLLLVPKEPYGQAGAA